METQVDLESGQPKLDRSHSLPRKVLSKLGVLLSGSVKSSIPTAFDKKQKASTIRAADYENVSPDGK